MGIALAFPIIIFVVMLQTVVISRLQLLNGSADLVLLVLIAWALQRRVKSAFIWAGVAGLVISLISATPLYLPLIVYLLIILGVRLLQRLVWQTPLMAMFAATTVGTFLQHSVYFLAARASGATFTLQDGLNLVTFPSVLLNLLFALPVYALILDLANRIYPGENEV